MLHEIRRWPLDYAILILGAVSALTAFFLSTDKVIQSNIGMGLGLFYTFWGIAHHWHTKTLTGKIMAEYAVFGLIVSLLIWLGLFY